VICLDSPEQLRQGRELLKSHLDIEAPRSARRENTGICLAVIPFKRSKQ
jgi:hypothetical protein